jgi:hypothetical protein
MRKIWDETGSGLNSDTEQHDYVRCARCGFPCRLSRDSHFPIGSRAGWGIKYVRFFIETTIPSADVSDSPTVTPAISGILTEEGLEILTEDGQTLIIE